MKIAGSLPQDFDFEVANFKHVGKRWFWRYEMWKIEDVSHEMLVLRLPHVSFGGSGWFSSAVSVSMGEAAIPSRKFQNKLSCRFAWQAWHFLTFWRVCKSVETDFVRQAAVQYFCIVCSRWVAAFVASAALWRPPSSFSVPGAALQRFRAACFWLIHFPFHTLNSTVYTPPSSLHTTLHTPHFTFYTFTPHTRFTLYTLHSTL